MVSSAFPESWFKVFPGLEGVREVFFDFVLFLGGGKFCLLSSRLRPAANKSNRAVRLRHCSRRGSRSVPRDTSRASPSVLETKNSCNSWSMSVVTPTSWRFDSEICCFLFFFCLLHYLFQHCMHHTSRVPCQVRPASPTRTTLLPEPIWHQNSSAPSTWYVASYRVFTAENIDSLMERLWCFVSCLMSCRNFMRWGPVVLE